MALKQLPRSHFAAMDFQSDRWPSPRRIFEPKTPPLELGGRHVEDPIRLEPGGHIVVAGHSDEAAGQVSAADALGDCGGADFRDVAVDDAGEFIEGDQWSRVKSQE